MKMKKNKISRYGVLPLIISLLFGGMSSVVVAATTAKTPENFALPFGLEGMEKVNAKAIPNLVFLIDDSKRTGEILSGGETKLEAYKSAVEQFIRGNTGKYRFGIARLYDIENNPAGASSVVLAHPDDSDGPALAALAALTVQDYEKAPIITSLTQVYKDMGESAIIYRCQQSYVYVISDGDSTGDNDKRLNMPTGDDVIFPEIAAFTKMKGKFDPYVPHLKKNENMGWFLDENGTLITKQYQAGDLLPKSLLIKPGYTQPCSFGAAIRTSYGVYNNKGPGLCYPQPSPDGYSTYAHFDDQDTYWDGKGISHKFDDPEYPVQSIYTSWFSSRATDVPPAENVVVAKNNYRAELLVSPETMATRGRGYYRFILSASGLSQSISEVAKKFQSNPALAMGRYYVPDVLMAGYRRPNGSAYQWKDEEKVIYLDYTAAQLKPEERMKLMPILRAVNYPNRWASAYVFSQLDKTGSGETEKFPDVINPGFAHNDSFAGRDALIQMVSFAMVNSSSSPYLINTSKGMRVVADEKNSGFKGYTDINGLTNEDFGIKSEDPNRLHKTWPFYFTLGTGPNYELFNKNYPGLSSSKNISLGMYGIRPNILASYSSFHTWDSEENLYQPVTLYDESYEPTTPAMENGSMFTNSVLTYGNKQRSASFFINNDSSSETGGGTVGMSMGVTRIAPSNQKQWTDKRYTFYGAGRDTKVALPSFQAGMVSSSNNGEVIMFQNTANWGLGGAYVYIPGAVKREKDETILQARTKAKHINYGDEDQPFRYVLNGQFAGVESRSYNYAAEAGYSDTYQNIVVGTTGQGGKGVFSLNGNGWLARTGFTESVMKYNGDTVMNRMTTDAERKKTIKQLVNWDSANNPHTEKPMEGLEKIGYTIGQPILAQMSMLRSVNSAPNVVDDVRIIAFVANGYNGTEDKPSLYVIDAAGADFGVGSALPKATNELGKVLKKIEMPVPGNNKGSNALNGAAIVDLDFNGVADIGYVGDYNGNLYRLDFRSPTVDGWKATLIYEGDPSQPITTSPTVYKDSNNSITVIFGTGSQIYKDDSMDTSVQSLYGIKDRFNEVPTDTVSYRSRDHMLTRQTYSEALAEGGNTVRLATRYTLGKKQGWYADLKPQSGADLGERVISNMEVIDNTLMVTSYYIKPEYLNNQSSGAICSVPMGYAGTWQMQLDAATGGAIDTENANTGQMMLSSGKKAFVAGVRYMDRIPPVSLSTTKNFPYNAQGQLLAGGKLYTPGKVFKPKECDGSDIVVSVGSMSDSSNNVSGTGVVCGKIEKSSSVVKRLSWRIIG